MVGAVACGAARDRTTGLVTLPGAFVGALFGGASPLSAARFQLVVLAGLLAAESVAAAVLLRLLADGPVLPAAAAPASPRHAALAARPGTAPAARPPPG